MTDIELFYFKCQKCKHYFKDKIGTKCPNCDTLDVKIINDNELIKALNE